jgi:hypothetical protein
MDLVCKLLPLVAWRKPRREQLFHRRFVQTGYISMEIATMTNNDQDKKPDSLAFHLVAIIAGLVMMVLGLGLGVTMVLLPIGLVLGLAGLGVLIWGLTPGWRK